MAVADDNNIEHNFLPTLPSTPSNHIRFYLCRHGQTDYNKSHSIQGRGINSNLNATGQKQANCIGTCFQSIPLDLVCSSSLTRAIETCDSIRKYQNSDVEYMKLSDFDEMSFGALEGKSFLPTKEDGYNNDDDDDTAIDNGYVELHKIMNQWKEGNYNVQFKGDSGESPIDVSARGVKGLQSIISKQQECSNNNVAIIAHGRFLKILLSHILYDDLGKMFELEQGNCCINVVDYCRDSKTFTPIILNFIGHIPEELSL